MKHLHRIVSALLLSMLLVIILCGCFGSSSSSGVNYAAKEDEKTNFNNLSDNGWFELYKATGVSAEVRETLKDKKLSDLTASEKADFDAYLAAHRFYLDIEEETYINDKTETNRKVYVVKELITGYETKRDKDGNPLYNGDGSEAKEEVYKGGEKLKATYILNGEEVERPIVYVEMSDLGLKYVDDTEVAGKKTLAVSELADQKGFLYYILMPVGKMLNFFNGIVPSYIFTLFIFAVIVKILLFFFGYKQQKSMVKQAYFKPKERAIRNKYKGRDDRATQQKMQQEIMEAQRAEGVSAFGGCMPMLIQLPVIMILYQVIINPLLYVANYSSGLSAAIKNVLCYNSTVGLSLADKVRTAVQSASPASITELNLVPVLRDNWSFFSSMPGLADKSAADLPNFYAFGNHIDLSVTPSITFEWPTVLYLLIPIITFVALFFTMKFNRKLTGGLSMQGAAEGAAGAGVANKIMDLVMPAMSTFFTFLFPAILGIYWIFNNLLGTVQQLILNKMVPFPVFTEEDYKKAEREYNKGKDVKKKQTSATVSDPNAPKPKSLHHIDDEEEEDYPVLPPIDEDKEPPVEEKKGRFGKASMKKDEEAPKMKDQENNENDDSKS